jgi:hypothetical protein
MGRDPEVVQMLFMTWAIRNAYEVPGLPQRLQSMFVQEEIYDKLKTEGSSAEWSEGAKAERELSRHASAAKADALLFTRFERVTRSCDRLLE